MKYLLFFLKEKKRNLILLVIFGVIFALLFWLNGVPAELAAYGFLLCFFFTIIVYGIAYMNFVRKMQALHRVSDELLVTLEHLPEAENGSEFLYQEIIRELHQAYVDRVQFMNQRERDQADYQALWAHQIKTPISAIQLLAGVENGNQDILEQVFRIEQYVEMILNYQRLSSSSSDWVLEKQPLDGILRQSIRKYAKLFIKKRLSLQYEGTDLVVLSDEKWLRFVIEQILSNALKYTKTGSIHIYTEEQRLYISDTGIGIQQSDLPRIFERGYTGYNGREYNKSTGIGLYLCKLICEKLGHGISVESQVGEGTTICLELNYLEVF